MSFPIYVALLILWAAIDLVLICLVTGRTFYGRRSTDLNKRKDDPHPDEYLGMGFALPFIAAWRKVSPWNGEERRDHERRSGA